MLIALILGSMLNGCQFVAGPNNWQTLADRYYLVHSNKSFAAVMDDLRFAIAQNNYRITGINTIGSGIQKRNHPLFPEANVVHFCNLEVAYILLQKAPDYLLRMPCSIALYQHGKQVHIGSRLLPEEDTRLQKENQQINQMLKQIIDYAADE